jgi:hypothetical protein
LELQEAQQRLVQEQAASFGDHLRSLAQDVSSIKSSQDASHADLHSKIDQHVRELRAATHRIENMVQTVSAAQEAANGKFEHLHTRLSTSGPNSIIGDLQRDLDSARAHQESGRVALTKRLDHLENSLGESSDKHHERIKALEVQLAGQMKAHAAQQAPLLQRVDHLEANMQEGRRAHAQSLSVAHARLDEMHGLMSEEREARASHAAAIEGLRSTHTSAWSEHHEARLAHGAAIDDLKKSHNLLVSELGSSATRHADFDSKLKAVEHLAANSAHDHARQLLSAQQQLQNCHAQVAEETAARNRLHASISDRLDKLDAFANATAEEHSARWQAAHSNLQDLHSQLSAGLNNRTAAHATIEERIKNVEAGSGDIAGKVTDLARRLNEEKDENSKKHSANAVHLRGLEVHMQDSVATQLQQMRSHVQGERDARDAQHSAIDRRLKHMEKNVSDSMAEHASQLQNVRQRLLTLQSSVADSAKAYEAAHAQNSKAGMLYGDGSKGYSAEECLKYVESMPATAPRLDATAAAVSYAGPVSTDQDYFRTAQKIVMQDDIRVATPPHFYQQPFTMSPPRSSPLGRVASLPALR